MHPLHETIEEAGLNAWPHLTAILHDGWLLRFGGNETRRINSVNAVGPSRRDLPRKIAHSEAAYRAQGIAPCFRILSTDDLALDQALAARGYAAEGLTDTRLCGNIADIPVASIPADASVELTPQPGDAWHAAHARFSASSPDRDALRRRLLDLIAIPAAFAAARDETGAVTSVAYAAVHDGMMSVQSVISDPDRRRAGWTRATLAALAGWAARSGATAACLQVQSDNAPAVALYQSLGFTTLVSRYHYRV